jgi:hypothetical protein
VPCPEFSQLPDEITVQILQSVEEVVSEVVGESVTVSTRSTRCGRLGNPKGRKRPHARCTHF